MAPYYLFGSSFHIHSPFWLNPPGSSSEAVFYSSGSSFQKEYSQSKDSIADSFLWAHVNAT